MSNYKDLSSEELKRTLAEKQDILRRTMKPDEYKKFMQELDDCQIKIDYSKFGKPVQYPETKKEKRQRKKEERILSKASREKPKILLFFATVLTKIFPLFLTIYTLLSRPTVMILTVALLQTILLPKPLKSVLEIFPLKLNPKPITKFLPY